MCKEAPQGGMEGPPWQGRSDLKKFFFAKKCPFWKKK